jgi:hypothetical protein
MIAGLITFAVRMIRKDEEGRVQGMLSHQIDSPIGVGDELAFEAVEGRVKQM